MGECVCMCVKYHKIARVIGWSLLQSNEPVFVYPFPCTAFAGMCQHLPDMNASVLIKVNESETRLQKFAYFN